MTRTAAREIAVHFAFELGFTNQTAEELLAEALNRKTFEQIGRRSRSMRSSPMRSSGSISPSW
ncbi:hypothetical protein M5E87_21890 [Flavonifractor plautii]|nr:hypothetical protein M5E87_21890 [Flavonifractor plautii]